MAKFSNKMMGKEVGNALTYAVPHTMNGKAAPMQTNPGKEPNGSAAANVNMSVGNINRNGYSAPKTDGIKIRGTGAATKGVMARGPMA
jgi:hypothetical protein